MTRLGFLPRDAAWIKSHPTITLGRSLGSGCVGTVKEIKGNKDLVCKVARDYSTPKNQRFAKRELSNEANDYKRWHLNELPIFIPSRVIKVHAQLGIIRPIVKMLVIYRHASNGTPSNLDKMVIENKSLVTEPMLRQFKRDLEYLTHLGFKFVDGLQLGIDEAGRILMYDPGFLKKGKIDDEEAFDINEYHWLEFIKHFGKFSKDGKFIRRK